MCSISWTPQHFLMITGIVVEIANFMVVVLISTFLMTNAFQHFWEISGGNIYMFLEKYCKSTFLGRPFEG